MGPVRPACWVLILCLLCVEVQPRPLKMTTMVHTHSLSLSRVPWLPESSPPIMTSGFDRPVALDNTAKQQERGVARRSPAPDMPSPRLSEASPDQNYRTPEGGSTSRRGPRSRRHANYMVGRSHVHLMRVGCILGTCQVQNLSHRLYQLIGQSGREDSSPINPRSPHSYG
ncbi:unnamed protein product [Merluccius merluccius]